MSVTIDGAGSLIGVDQGLNIVGLTTLTGGIILDDSISHIGDTNTKIRFPAADTITAETGGTERLRIKSNGAAYFTGNLGLGGQTSPSGTIHINDLSANGYELKVTGNAIQFNRTSSSYIDQINDTGSILFRMGSSYTEAMRITSAGKIGINDTNPERAVDIRADNCMVQLEGTGGNGRQYSLCSTDDTTGASAGSAGSFVIYDDTSSTARLTVTSAGKIGINNTAPEGVLTIEATAAEPPTSGTTANSAIQLYSSLSNHMNFGLNTVNGGYGGYIQVSDNNHAANYQLNLNPNGGSVIVGSNVAQAHANMDDLQVGNGSGNRGITISSGTSNYGTVAFGDSADGSGTDRYEGFIEYYHDDNSMRLGTVHQERLRIGSGGGHKITCAEGYYAANLTECNDGRIALNINQTRSGQTKAIAIGAISGNSATGIQCYDTSNNSANNLLLNPFGGNVGVGIDNPGEHLHISGAVRRDTPGSSNIKFLEFSFELPSGSTTTIATVTGPVVSSMAIAKFEYVGLYDYSDVGFYSGVEMASLRRSNSNSAYTYLQNSEIHAGGNNSSYQPNMFWQNGSNNTSDLMITTGSYVIIMGTIRITTFNLGLSRVISI